ncbi:hypothetical protein AHiyo8_07800 [Arthrobacter sp. Hiyo8]|nr:hypothetical protein AHiyo8_07800 [Arthrobacter sp. Hiyo8]GAP59695.1 hypothetical protein AHiyo1_30510 [Arthrobacter sp. Hiyo1]
MKKSLTERGPKMGKRTSAAIVLTAVLALTACAGDIPSATRQAERVDAEHSTSP